MKRHKTNLKPIACNAIHAGDGKRKTESGYIIDCVDNRLLLRKWPNVYFEAPKQVNLYGS